MYVLQFKKIEVSISSESKDTMNRTIKFFRKTPYKSMTRRGIIPRGVMFWRIFYRHVGIWYPRVSYCAESVLPGYDTPGSHGTKFFIISPRGRTPPQVKLTGVAYPGKSVFQGYDTPGSHSSRPSGVNSHFLKLLQRPLKGQCHKNKCGSLFYY